MCFGGVVDTPITLYGKCEPYPFSKTSVKLVQERHPLTNMEIAKSFHQKLVVYLH